MDSVKEVHLITGGGGYVGYHIAKELTKQGFSVVLLDVSPPVSDLLDDMIFIQGDVRNVGVVRAAAKGVSCVYHVASYGMSGREQIINPKLIEEVNVNGTQNVIEVCCNLDIERLVYTSTYNVVFVGEVIENGDESLPYPTLDKYTDMYSKTKALAEKAVLSANGTSLQNGGILRTCALRLAGVYGPEEQRTLPRILHYIANGYFICYYGDRHAVNDFLHIENLVQGHVLAGQALTEKRNNIAAGQIYFLTDGKPVNSFEFFRPLAEGLGYKVVTFPSVRLPIGLVYYFAYLTEIVHRAVWRVYDFQPFLIRTEVYASGVSHFFSIQKATRQLGYKPTKQNDLTIAVEHFRKRGHQNPIRNRVMLVGYPKDLVLICVFLMMACLLVVTYFQLIL